MNPRVVQFLHIRREHFGAFAGIQRLIPYIDKGRFSVRVRAVHDGDDDFPRTIRLLEGPVHGLLRFLVQRHGQGWYNLSDLAAEGAVLRPWIAGEIDVLHYLDGEHTAQYLPAFPARWRRRGRAVATYHQPPSVLPDVVVPAVVRRLDHVTVVAASQLEYFSRLLPESRLSVLHHGVDTEFFRRTVALPGDGIFRCVAAGSYLRDWKLLAELATIVRPHKDIELHVVSGSAPSFDWLDNVRVHRNVDDYALRDIYARADIAVLPLVDSTANNALLESMAMGLPLVVSDLASVREYACADAAIFLPNEGHRFAESIIGLKTDAALKRTMGLASRARAETLAWPSVARTFEALYDRLA
jgi:glycosyltransferase involved in cell wall biosynthesis